MNCLLLLMLLQDVVKQMDPSEMQATVTKVGVAPRQGTNLGCVLVCC